MAKGLVVYYSRSGNTKEMAEIIAKAMNDSDLPTECKSVDKIKVDDLLAFDAIVVGSPTYYGHMAAPIKQLFDDSVAFHGRLDGKVGAAFSSAANIGGGQRNHDYWHDRGDVDCRDGSGGRSAGRPLWAGIHRQARRQGPAPVHPPRAENRRIDRETESIACEISHQVKELFGFLFVELVFDSSCDKNSFLLFHLRDFFLAHCSTKNIRPTQ